MGRSIKKGPFIDGHLMDKIIKAKDAKSKAPIKTWSRRSMITPDFVGLTFNVHNGKVFNPVFVTENMVGQIQGLPAAQAHAALQVIPRKGARFVAKTLKSAMANAEDLKEHHKEYGGLNTEDLVIKEAVAQTAATIRRFTPKARGSAGPILKRSCHIKIVLWDQQPPVES